MKKLIESGFVMTLLLAGACGTSQSGRVGAETGGTWGGGGTAGGGASGSTGIAGDGAAGAGGSSGGASGGSYGPGAGGATGGSGGAVTGGGLGGAAWLTPPAIPPALAVPAGAMIKAHTHAVGAQIYTCTVSSAGADAGATTYAWTLKAPEAQLFDASGVQVGTHGAGPNWTSSDGSVAIGAKVAGVDAPAAGSIQWLLLRVSSTSGAGVFSDVTFVQRLNTAGGAAPATGCDSTTAGMETRAGYSADYYFYVGGTGAAWLTLPANVPDALGLPGSVVLAFHDRGIGAQVYTCRASAAGAGGAGAGSATTYAWGLDAPDAILYDMTFTQVGTHGSATAGPSWTSTDGSVLVAKELAEAPSPQPDAVPWVMLKEFAVSGPSGAFTNVSIVQRLNTAGGTAPASGCDAATVNTQTRVPYSADYYFFKDFGTTGG